jgi:hypothetical protein
MGLVPLPRLTSRTIATASDDGFLRIWDPRARAVLWETAPAAAVAPDCTSRWLTTLCAGEGGWLACGGGFGGALCHVPGRIFTSTLGLPSQSMVFTADGVGTS